MIETEPTLVVPEPPTPTPSSVSRPPFNRAAKTMCISVGRPLRISGRDTEGSSSARDTEESSFRDTHCRGSTDDPSVSLAEDPSGVRVHTIWRQVLVEGAVWRDLEEREEGNQVDLTDIDLCVVLQGLCCCCKGGFKEVCTLPTPAALCTLLVA
jgi:hypothetical protein